MFRKIKDWIGQWLFSKELTELNRWKIIVDDYQRFLSEFPEITLTLENLKLQVEDKIDLDSSIPPMIKGPWTVIGLRYTLRNLNKNNIEYVEDTAIQKLISHYCEIMDQLGDTPIPDFENWAEVQARKGHELLEECNYGFRKRYQKVQKRVFNFS